MSSVLAICPAPFQRPKHKRTGKSKHSPKAGGLPPVEIFDRFMSPSNMTSVSPLDEPIVRRHSPQSTAASPQLQASPHQAQYHHHHHLHYISENDSQQSSSTGSNESHSTHTSGYVTDDGTFEGKVLRRATRDRPANILMTAIRDYVPCCGEELSVRRGQRIKVLYKNNDWVYAVNKAGEAGYVPYSFVRPSRKNAGYQSEPEMCYNEYGAYNSGYETDLPVSYGRRGHHGHHGHHGHRTQIGDVVPAYSVHAGFHGSAATRHNGFHRVGSNSPLEGRRGHASGYSSAVEYPPSPETYHHHRCPRPAKSLHNILDASSSQGYRPMERKPDIDSFGRGFMEELVVIHDFEAQEEDEVFVGKGERVKVLNADDPFWLWVETTPGDEGFIPRSCCSLGNHPLLQTNPTRRHGPRQMDRGRQVRRYYDRSRQQFVARQARTQAKQRFHELAKLRSNPQNPVCMDKEEIQRVGSKLIVLMDYTATQDDELSIEFAETLFADVLKQTGAERIWAYCPRNDKCGYVPISLVVPPVV